MAYCFEFDATHRIIRGRLIEQITDQELMDFYRTIALLCGLLAPHAGIADLSEATSFVTPGKIRELAKLPPAMPEPARPRFIVAPSDDLYGLARMFQIEGEDTRPNLHVIRSAEDAFSMLGVEKPSFEPVSRVIGSVISIPRNMWEEQA